MKLAIRLLTILVILGLITGVILIIIGKIAFTGVIWAITSLIACLTFRLAKNKK